MITSYRAWYGDENAKVEVVPTQGVIDQQFVICDSLCHGLLHC